MAVRMLKSVVLDGVTARRGGSVGPRLGFDTASGKPLALQISFRHPSQGGLQTGQEPGQRRDQTASHGLDNALNGAGRPPSRAGVLVRRSPAKSAGGTVPYGWSPAERGSMPTTVMAKGLLQTDAMASVGDRPFRRPKAFLSWLRMIGGIRPMPIAYAARVQGKANPAGVCRAGGTLSASTRGKGGR